MPSLHPPGPSGGVQPTPDGLHLACNLLVERLNIIVPDNANPTTLFLARLFHENPVEPLLLYRCASFLREGQLREIVQFLTALGPQAALTVARLLNIMRGLPGNWELASDFLHKHKSSFSSFEPRACVLFAFVGGPKVLEICNIKSLIETAFNDSHEDARLALAICNRVLWTGPREQVHRVFHWDSQAPYASDPSFWREVEWAAHTRACCTSERPTSTSQTTETPSTQPDSDFEPLAPSSDLNDHFLRIGGLLVRHRNDCEATLPSKTQLAPTRAASHFIVTPTLRTILRDSAKVLTYGLSLLLEGPSGCGKTSLLSLLAEKMISDSNPNKPSTQLKPITFIQMDSAMSDADGDSLSSLIGSIVPLPEGGGFRWRPGPIGLAVQRGDWIVFENIGNTPSTSSAVHIIRQLASLEPGDELEAPGRGEPLYVGRGFRCIATHTVHETSPDRSWKPPGGWDLWVPVSMKSLSNKECEMILCERFPLIRDCVPRVVNCLVEAYKLMQDRRGPLFRLPSLREAVRACSRLEAVRSSDMDLTAEMALMECLDVFVNWCSNGRDRDDLLCAMSQCWSLSIEVGRAVANNRRPDFSLTTGTVNIGRAILRRSTDVDCAGASRLALNGSTLRLLERTLRCLEMNESVLLTGEAGSGKTAAVQELAYLLQKKLVVVNLSRQSELGDLLGGFRPVEMSAAVSMLARKFEATFCEGMSRDKNGRFLSALQRACGSAIQHHRALRLMRGAMKAVPKRVKHSNGEYLQQWQDINRELIALEKGFSAAETRPDDSRASQNDSQEQEPPKKRPRHSTEQNDKLARHVNFKFFEGALPQAMRKGHWILLDEINLAPPELLERLISVLDNGQVILSNEEGEVVTQDQEFVLFGSMNPPTDVGKRPLPPVLRTRFSEFSVGDTSDKSDIVTIVLQRLFHLNACNAETVKSTSYEGVLARDLADFFIACSTMGNEGSLEDGSGKPVRFSLRHLSRTLDYAAGLRKHLLPGADATRMAVLEGAIMSFSTSLPTSSRSKLISLAKRFMLPKPQATRTINEYLRADVRQRNDVHVLEGIPIEKRSDRNVSSSSSSPTFIISPTVRNTMKDICRAMALGVPHVPILLQGPTAAGKTSLIRHLAHVTGNHLMRINNHEHTDIAEYIGTYVASENGSLVFTEGPLVRAARQGCWILLDELNLAPPDVLESLNRLLDDNREIFVTETGEAVKAAAGFRLFATQNPAGLYGGRKQLSRAFRSRFLEVQVGDLPDEDLLIILESSSKIPQSFARKMITVMRELQIRRKTSSLFTGREGWVTVRDLFRWSFRSPRSKDELAVQGFFLLGERAREPHERELVREILIKTIGISADVLCDDSLYRLDMEGDRHSPSRECLDESLKKLGTGLKEFLAVIVSVGLVLTPHMRRLIVLLVHCVANNEPALLVGVTGGGKTSCCAAICRAILKILLTVNCHRNTEASDILGGYRPCRDRGDGLFEWCNGPLVTAMKEGGALLVDEINMADDAVIERLNSVLEYERSLFLSEKGHVASETDGSFMPEVVNAAEGFRLLATMNPGGDFGKRELSPALRNRFTELWIPQPSTLEDYYPIIEKKLSSISESQETSLLSVQEVVKAFCSDTLSSIFDESRRPAGKSHSLSLSLRDVTNWCEFIVHASTCVQLNPMISMVHGARLVFLDGLSVGSSNPDDFELEKWAWNCLLSRLPPSVRAAAEAVTYTDVSSINLEQRDSCNDVALYADCFPIRRNTTDEKWDTAHRSPFSFNAPNTIRNTVRVARALSTRNIPVLLEGPPGGGKSSLIAALASVSEFCFTRVNLSDSTEMSDLLGTDAPGEEQGTFVFREGPLLRAVRRGWWILLDELNLASQSVLEGLNSILDHRRSLFIPELGEEVTAHPNFRLFGAQNPAVHGGGRRGLPRSFLNRFAKVWIESPGAEDLYAIARELHPKLPSDIVRKTIKVLSDVNTELSDGVTCSASASSLRDLIRWLDLVHLVLRGSNLDECPSFTDIASRVCGELFHVIVLQALGSEKNRKVASECFAKVFGHQWNFADGSPSVQAESNQVLRIGLSSIRRVSPKFETHILEPLGDVLQASRLREVQALSFAAECNVPVVMWSNCSAITRFEGRRIVEALARSSGKTCRVVHGGSLSDFEDFVGGFTQQDLRRAMRVGISLAADILRATIEAVLTLSSEVSRSNVVCLYDLVQELKSETQGLALDSSGQELADRYLVIFRSIERMALVETDRTSQVSVAKRCQAHISEIELLRTNLANSCTPSFKWKKSEFLNAIERGDWIFVEDADCCPPAVLDRLNPLLERSTSSKSGTGSSPPSIVIAEAPSEPDGSPVYLKPHPDFRIFFGLSSASGGRSHSLSKALLDRSLQVSLNDKVSTSDILSISTCMGSPSLLNNFPCDIGECGYFRDLQDPWMHAQRRRVCLASSLGEGQSVQKPTITTSDDGTHSEDVGSYLSTIVRSSIATVSSNSSLCLLERDLSSLRILLWMPGEKTFERLLRVSEQDSPKGTPLAAATSSGLTNPVAHDFVLRAGLESVVMGSCSIEDCRMRLESSISLIQELAGDGLHRVQNFVDALRVLLSSSSWVNSLTTCQEGSKVTTIDPVYAMDASSILFLESVNGANVETLQKRAKLFRLSIISLQHFRFSFEQALRHSSNYGRSTRFSDAQNHFTLQSAGHTIATDSSSIDLYAFEILHGLYSQIVLVSKELTEAHGWRMGGEPLWLRFIEAAQFLCVELCNPDGDVVSSLIILLLRLRSLEAVVTAGPKLTEWVQGLTEKGNYLMKPIMKIVERGVPNVTPKSEEGLLLEKQLWSTLSSPSRDFLRFVQADAAYKALTSLRSASFETRAGALESVCKVIERIRAPEKYVAEDTMGHFVVLRDLAYSKSILRTALLVHRLPTDDSVRKNVQNCVKLLKLSPSTSPDSVISLQSLQWLQDISNVCVEGADQEDVNVAAKSVMTACYRELSHAFDERLKECKGLGGSLHILREARRPSCSFWDLPSSMKESLSAVSLVGLGVHSTSNLLFLSRELFVNSLLSALLDSGALRESDFRKFQKSNRSNMQWFSSLMGTVNSVLEEQALPSQVQDAIRSCMAFADRALDSHMRIASHFKAPLSNPASVYKTAILLGVMCLSIGVLRITVVLQFLESFHGFDPSNVAQGLTTCSLHTSVKAAGCSLAYEVIGNNRLGSGDASRTGPVRDFMEHSRNDFSVCESAYRKKVYRPDGRSSFKSFENSLRSVVSMVLRVLEESKLARYAEVSESFSQQSWQELGLLRHSLLSMIEKLEYPGLYSHFRDLTVDAILSVREIVSGLSLYEIAAEAHEVTKKGPDCLTDCSWYMFPRAAFPEKISFVDAVKNCFAQSRQYPNALHPVCGYLIMQQLNCKSPDFHGLSDCFTAISQEWKRSIVHEEDELEKKKSLHVIREAASRAEVKGSDNIETLEGDEEEDFVKTFNPLSAEIEDMLLGVQQVGSSDEVQTNVSEEMSKDCDVRIDGRLFHSLHDTCFSPKGVDHSQALVLYREHVLKRLPPHLHDLITYVSPAVDALPSPWPFLCCTHILRQFQGSHLQSNVTENDPILYNFYLDSNPSETLHSSRILALLREAIQRVQSKEFSDIDGHPVLSEVSSAIERVAKTCKSGEPLSQTVVGIENVLRKADQWHRLFAKKTTRLDHEVGQLSALVLQWRRLEMNSWKHLLRARKKKFTERASQWFFLLYDAVVNHIHIEGQHCEDAAKDILSSVDRFLRSSPVGEFEKRINTVASIACHVLTVYKNHPYSRQIGESLKLLSNYYNVQLPAIAEQQSAREKVIFKKLQDFEKLVSWTPEKDLGSSQKMMKDQNKDHDYFRLKAASEKTRRKIHKLCVELDALYRSPVYTFMSSGLSKLGLDSLKSEEKGSDPKSSAITYGFSTQRMVSAVSLIRSSFRTVPSSAGKAVEACSAIIGNGRSTGHVLQTMSQLSLSLSSRTDCSLDKSIEGIPELRSKIRQAVDDFRTSDKGTIQVKKRCVASLLKELTRLGLSPYESVPLERRTSVFWHGAPDPTLDSDYNSIGNNLYVTVLSQLGRLSELSDSRLRNADFTADEATRARNLCVSLFDNICLERNALNAFFSRLSFFKSQAHSLISLSTKSDQVVPPRWSFELLLSCKRTISKLEMITHDYKIVRDAQLAAGKLRASDLLKVNQERGNLRELLLDHLDKDCEKDLSNSLRFLEEAINAIQEVVNCENVAVVRNIPNCRSALLHNNVGSKLDGTKHAISSLLSNLNDLVAKMEQAPDSLAVVLLQPTIAMLHQFDKSVSGTSGNTVIENENDDGLPSTSQTALQEITETVLLATQDILSWGGVREVESTETKGNNANEKSKLFRKAHAMVMKLAKNEKLETMDELLNTNYEHLSRLASSRNRIGAESLNKFLSNQQTTGVVLHSFLQHIMAPCITRMLEFHYRSMNLLRTISSLFIGLCEQGYCRPPEENEGDMEETSEVKDGTGFGEAGDGDMSGAQDVSEQIEDEEQLLGLKEDQLSQKPETDPEQQQTDEGFEMTNDFDGELEDTTKKDNDGEMSDEEEPDKEMSNEKGTGEDVVDEKLWSGGSDNAPAEEDNAKSNSVAADDQNDLVARDEQKENESESKEPQDVGHGNDAEGNQEERVDQTESGVEKEDQSKSSKQKTQSLPEDDDNNPSEVEEATEDGESMKNPDNENDVDDINEADHTLEDVLENESSEREEKQGEGKDSDGRDSHTAKEETVDRSGTEDEDAPSKEQAISDEQMNEEGDGEDIGDEPMNGTSTIPEQTSPDVKPDDEDSNLEDLSDLNLDKAASLNNEDGDESSAEGANENEEPTDDMDVDDVSKYQKQNNAQEDDGNMEDVESLDVARTAEESNMTPQNMDLDGHADSFVHSAQRSKMGVSSEKTRNEDQDDGQEDGQDTGPSEADGIGSSVSQSADETTQMGSGLEQDNAASEEVGMQERLADPNPFRQVADSSLAEQWKRITEMLEQDGKDQDPDTSRNDGDSKLWEFSQQNEESNKDHAGLAAATEEQHKPLPDEVDDIDEDNKEKIHDRGRNQSSGKAKMNQTLSEVQDENQTLAEVERDEDMRERAPENQEVLEHPAKISFRPEDEDAAHVENLEMARPILEQRDSREERADPMKMNEVVEGNNEDPWLIEKLDIETSCKLWSSIDAKVSHAASSLCEQLRLVLEPTLSSGLAGGYRTGKRLNMRKVIEYVASEFRKDRIWLRRVKPDKRTYDVLLAIDDSESMTDSGAGSMAIESLALVLSALSKLEVGRVAVVSFGSETKLVRDFDDGLPISVEAGGSMLRSFSFSQKETNIVRLMEYISSKLASSLDNEHVTLAFVVSDGRLSHREEIRRYLRKLKAANVLVAFLILDKGPKEDSSIFDVKRVEYDASGKVSVMPYMQDFPVDFYAVIRDVGILPSVFSDALRQWIETTNSQL